MSLPPLHQHSMEQRGSQFYSDRVLQSTEVFANNAQAEAVVCERCGKQVHPANWMKHQKSDHGDDPKPLHEAQKDDHLPIAAIRMDGGTQPRAAINDETVADYAESMNEGAKFPAITVFFDGQDYWLADGFHRVNAAKLLAWLELPADVHQGTQRDAVLFSVGVNATHGLRRTNMDKRRAVDRLLRDEEWAKWSDREIARRCGVSDRFVNNVRKVASANGSQIDSTRIATRNGTTYPVNTGNIGKSTPPVVPAPQPAPSAAITAQATQAFPPVTRPPAVTYSKAEDDYQDDVPSTDADDPDWLDDALSGKEPDAAEPTTFQIGNKVSTQYGRTGGEIIEVDPLMGALVKFPGSTPWWLKTKDLVLEKEVPAAEPIVFNAGDIVHADGWKTSAVVVKVEIDLIYVEFYNDKRSWIEPTKLTLVNGKVEAAPVSQARADLEQVADSPARERLTAIVDQQEKADADRKQRIANWQEHERRRTLAAQTPPPVGQYRTIVVDPPWPMKKIERGVRPNQGEYLDYPTMQLAEIYNLGIEKLAADDGCHLYLWTTHKFLPEALKMVSRWGFRYNCLMTWVKTTGMTPYSYRFNTEHVVFATRGSMAVQRKGLPLAFEGESLGHSRKPDTFYNMIAQASPGPRLDMFARCEREGFSLWGNEIDHA